MTRFERWLIAKVIKKEVRMGGHGARITNLYKMIRDGVEKEFNEDNYFTIDDVTQEWFEETLYDKSFTLLRK
jgi:hypothetical protein